MKILKTLSLLLFLSFIGCNETVDLKDGTLNQLLNNFLNSGRLSDFGLSIDQLDQDQAAVVKSPDKKFDILVIPLRKKSNPSLREPETSEYVATYYQGMSAGVSYKGTILNQSTLPIKTALSSGTFTGKLTFQAGLNSTTFEIKNGSTIKVITNRCGIVDAGACAARTIDEMETFSYIACVVEIPICFAILVADCLKAGCPWTV
ncbi:MAG TPA: hypothetical protein VFW11_16655 [Cyclobacteriaceae bacterium]|nr:hypothetical protein [Cyclobacteriaceae bacterium]